MIIGDVNKMYEDILLFIWVIVFLLFVGGFFAIYIKFLWDMCKEGGGLDFL